MPSDCCCSSGQKRLRAITATATPPPRPSPPAVAGSTMLIAAMVLCGLTVNASAFVPSSSFVGRASGTSHLGDFPDSRDASSSKQTTRTTNTARSKIEMTSGESSSMWSRSIASGKRVPRSFIKEKKKWGVGVWSKLTNPPKGRAHDEVTFRSGFEGRTLTIPQAERYSSAAWWHNVKTLPSSVILHRIKQPLLAQTFWATAVSIVHAALGGTWSMSIKPHTLLGSALGLLLVFRTNAAYQRFQEGRKLWEQLLNVSRDIARMSSLYEGVFGRKLVRRIANLLACHAVILQEHLQGYKLPQVWQDLMRRDEVLELMTTTCNRPLMVVNKISKEIMSVPYISEDWTSRERLSILSMCNKLGETIGGCERLVQTPVPLHYVRHTSRFLTIWCFLLPLVIVGEMGLGTAPVVGLATWALFGIQEIGLLIEDPFQSALGLEIMCNTIFSDVMQTIGAAEPSFPQDIISTESEITFGDNTRFYRDGVFHDNENEEVLPLSARCKHPALDVRITQHRKGTAGLPAGTVA